MRLKALLADVSSALTEHQMTVTGLGRNLKSYSKTKTKHDIKRMDRLIGNKPLLAERQEIYQYLTKHLVGNQKHPILIADWSPIPGSEIFQLLRVSIPMGGRALTIYEECFIEKKLNKIPKYTILFWMNWLIYFLKGTSQLFYQMPFVKHLGLKVLKQKIGIGWVEYVVMFSCL